MLVISVKRSQSPVLDLVYYTLSLYHSKKRLNTAYSIYRSYTFNGSVLKLLGYSEKLLQRLKLINSIVENIFQLSFWKI